MPAIGPIQYATPEGQVRLLIADVDEDDALFSDDQIGAFLTIAAGNIKRAAARALDTIAVTEVLIAKKIRTQDLSTDGPAVAKALREQAQALRNEADADDEASDGFFFDIVPGPGHSCGPELTEHPTHFGWT